MLAFSSLNPFNFEKPAAWGPTAKNHLQNIARAEHNGASNGAIGTHRYNLSESELEPSGEEASKTATHEQLQKWLNEPAGQRGSLVF